ncbi:Homeodomain-like protein [Lipomyces japonicus]|uniref:Homeodomain-like protein n=1 Tax=Lipomyces japonicus TaxID=56871 RepID=UPI0034CDFD9A
MAQRRGPWSAAEDAKLLNFVNTYGAANWVRISQLLGTRTAKQCRERYHQNLKPSLNHSPISSDEGLLIESLVNELGNKWAEIARHLAGRSDNAIKNWWNGGANRRRRGASSNEPSKPITVPLQKQSKTYRKADTNEHEHGTTSPIHGGHSSSQWHYTSSSSFQSHYNQPLPSQTPPLLPDTLSSSYASSSPEDEEDEYSASYFKSTHYSVMGNSTSSPKYPQYGINSGTTPLSTSYYSSQPFAIAAAGSNDVNTYSQYQPIEFQFKASQSGFKDSMTLMGISDLTEEEQRLRDQRMNINRLLM